MNKVIFTDDGLMVYERNAKFYVQYDAGAHQIALREDEVSEEEVGRLMASPNEATKVLFDIQNRLIQAGIDPYKSNINSIPTNDR